MNHLAKFIEITNLRLLASKNNSMEKYCLKRKRLEKERFKAATAAHTVILTDLLLNRSNCEIEKEDICEAGDFHSMYTGPQPEVCSRKLNLDGFLYHKTKDEYRYAVTHSLLDYYATVLMRLKISGMRH